MRLVTYLEGGERRPGLERDGRVYSTTRLLGGSWRKMEGPESIRRILEDGTEVMLRLLDAISSSAAEAADVGPLAELELAAPVPDPQKIVCVGLNYRDHAEEAGLSLPGVPLIFAKFPNALAGPHQAVQLPRESAQVDYEGELAVVIGRIARSVAPEQALTYVAGAMCLNDISARDMQFETSQFIAGKTFDTFAPCGPALVTLDEIADPQALGIRARVNGQTMQDSSTAAMIFSVAELVSFLSRRMTLVPGDVISTGTPAGVGMGRKPPVYLKDGDVVEVEIDTLGRLENPVVQGD